MGKGGNQPQNTTQTVISQQQLPAWYNAYLQDLIGNSQADASAKYQPYRGQRTADFTPQQQQAMQGISALQGSATPYYNMAQGDYNNTGNYLQDAQGYGTLASNYGAAAADNTYFSQGASAIAGGLGAASNIYGAQSPYLAQARGLIGSGTNTNLLGIANPYIQQAVSQPTGLQAASPYLGAASQSLPNATMNNMSPYLGGAMDALSNQAAYDLQNKYLPAVNDSFIHAGQFGSTRNQDITAQTLHDTQQNVLNAQAGLLNSAYGQAGQLAESNLGLQGQLAQTAGGLGTAQQQALLGAGSTLGTLGGAQAGLQLQGAGQTAGLGSQAGNALAQQAGLGIQGGSALGNIGSQSANANLGAGQLALGAGNMNLGIGNASTQLGNAQMNLGTTGQDQSLKMLNALYSSGAQSQNMNQNNLNTAYQDWMNQTYYPQNQMSWLSNIVHGLPSIGAGQTTQTQQPYNPMAQIGGLLTAGMGMYGMSQGQGGGYGSGYGQGYGGGMRKGGRVMKLKRGGKVSFQDEPGSARAELRGLGQFQKVA